MAMESMTEALDLPASERASASFALLEPKITASNSKKERKVMDKGIEKCGTYLSDKITSCSIPGDGQLHSKSKHVSKIRGKRATMTVAGETSSCENPDSIKFFRVTDSRKSCHEAVMRENKEMSTSMINNPGKCAKSNDNSYRCFDCGDAFNAKNDLIQHLKIHFGSGNFDIDANLTIGKDLALKTLVSGGETNTSHQPTSSKSLDKLICNRKGMRQNVNGLFKANFGGTRKEKNVREVRKSFTVDGRSCTDSSHSAKKPYSSNECEQSNLVLHLQTHAEE
ncbi:zinc finger protein with KRAB and SCAN domains 7-like [Ischnura elegans]|uniref:zinc finger protein with KRAB and SCAN domains 7-like n=1 Tax=Ischnura elegans TaxID=197161 RepID=UPI001ED88AAD|nr:zinc finger protein with KRAB and SCAN domains 7-like [Ischnura elegans]